MRSLSKFTTILLALSLLFVSCDDGGFGFENGDIPDPSIKGYLVISDINVTVDSGDKSSDNIEEDASNKSRSSATRASTPASDDFIVKITDSEEVVVLTETYGEIKEIEDTLALAPGTYKIEIYSPNVAQNVAWEDPIYYGTISTTIVKRQTKRIDDLVCQLTNIKSTVALSADLRSLFAPDAGSETDFKVALSLMTHKLEYSLAETRAGFFKAQEATNVIDIELSGMYNTAAADAEPTYIFVKWKHQIKNVKAGEWRKVAIDIEHTHDGNVKFIATVEKWVYGETIVVDVMSSVYTFGEEEIEDPDLEITVPFSPVVTLANGHDIKSPFIVNSSSFDFEGFSTDKIQAIVTPTVGSTVIALDAIVNSDNEALMSALAAASYQDNRITLLPTNQLSGKVITASSGDNLLMNVTNEGMTAIYGYEGTHTVTYVAKDSENRRSFTTLTIVVARSSGGGGSGGPSIVWVGGDFDIRHELTSATTEENFPVVIEVNSDSGITGFEIQINSATLTESVLGALGLATSMDLINPATPLMEEQLTGLGFPIKDEVSGKKSLRFDITPFMPLLAMLGSGETDFVFTVTDASGTTTKTLMLNVVQ